ncbi:hypothetical protein CRG98_005585 [Punica granatum]|uniref:Uncharacterized protein n=1 Tax=Punica granatum TaxID=22663 RepID=A0A2I0KZZ8_PUNGR|nr:hypothetical protein CRG98_005585 [Punica granatum]
MHSSIDISARPSPRTALTFAFAFLALSYQPRIYCIGLRPTSGSGPAFTALSFGPASGFGHASGSVPAFIASGFGPASGSGPAFTALGFGPASGFGHASGSGPGFIALGFGPASGSGPASASDPAFTFRFRPCIGLRPHFWASAPLSGFGPASGLGPAFTAFGPRSYIYCIRALAQYLLLLGSGPAFTAFRS